MSSNLTASAKTIMQKENTNEPDEEEKSDEQIIEEIVKLTSEIYDLDYAK